MNRHTKRISSCLLTTSLLVACGHSEAKSNLEQERPVIERAAQILNAPGLAKLAVLGIMEYQTGRVSNHLIDLTGNRTTAENERFQRTQAYIVQAIEATQPSIQIVKRPDGTRQTVTERFINLAVGQRNYLFITKDQLSLSQVAQGASVTAHIGDQTTSLISEDSSPNPRQPQITNKVINEDTEICQSEVETQTQGRVDDGTAAVLQEAFCNGLGRSVAAHQLGLSYSQYIEGFGNLVVSRDGYKVDQYTASSVDYSSIPI